MSQAALNPVIEYLQALQARTCRVLEHADGQARFIEDDWQRDEGGGGRTCILKNGRVFEQAGVGFSHVFGQELPPSASCERPELAGCSFQATGLSIVIHPLNPYVPTTHCNVRFFMAERDGQEPVWWFGGGFDLTPYYGFHEDAVAWHRAARDACDAVDEGLYEKFKKNCDEYFYIQHRNEARGIGGLFFDDYNTGHFEQDFRLLKSVGEHFLKAYLPIVARKAYSFGDRERRFQLYRRGRYVEFNLVYDRGTLFGLQSGGRTESILMSLPPQVRFDYDWHPPGSREEALYKEFLPARDWLE